jgi:hypothetical protein
MVGLKYIGMPRLRSRDFYSPRSPGHGKSVARVLTNSSSDTCWVTAKLTLTKGAFGDPLLPMANVGFTAP